MSLLLVVAAAYVSIQRRGVRPLTVAYALDYLSFSFCRRLSSREIICYGENKISVHAT